MVLRGFIVLHATGTRLCGSLKNTGNAPGAATPLTELLFYYCRPIKEILIVHCALTLDHYFRFPAYKQRVLHRL